MQLVRLTESSRENGYGKDSVPDEKEWHCLAAERCARQGGIEDETEEETK